MDTKEKESKFCEEQIAKLKDKKKFYKSKIDAYAKPGKAKDYHYRARAKVELAELPDFIMAELEKRQKYESAIQDLDEAIKGEKDDYHQMWNYHLRAKAKVELGKRESAINDLNKALQLYPDEHGRMWNYHLQARVYCDLGLFECASADIEEAEKIDPVEYQNNELKKRILRKRNEEDRSD